MEEKQFENELRYYTLMHHVRRMLRAGLITGEEFSRIGREYGRKYRPVFGGLLEEKDLLEARIRGTVDGGREGNGGEDQRG